jgi:hypothetical protein
VRFYPFFRHFIIPLIYPAPSGRTSVGYPVLSASIRNYCHVFFETVSRLRIDGLSERSGTAASFICPVRL